MKFQNPILNLQRTDGRTHGRMDKPKAKCPFKLFKVGGIKRTPPPKQWEQHLTIKQQQKYHRLRRDSSLNNWVAYMQYSGAKSSP